MPNNQPPPGYEETFATGFNNFIGPIFVASRDDGTLHFILDVADQHLNAGGVVHGGVLMSLADVALGMTVFERIDRLPCATINLDCNFLAAGKPGERLQADADVTRVTQDVVFVEGRVYTAARKLLTAQGIWKIIHKSPAVSEPS